MSLQQLQQQHFREKMVADSNDWSAGARRDGCQGAQVPTIVVFH